jgi:hypothetical protein
MALIIGLLQGPTGGLLLMSEVPLYPLCITLVSPSRLLCLAHKRPPPSKTLQ